ncbi:hypothetical protein J1605_005150 [Eschrichtius robustus]|uniref:Secreted protein n=1 Tax=Eschrichtius robustus TaxID=9764 RepID=A0AB34HE20_ESCRO|nr:hypothetical protein J1605_005150 [Eschrichtius robustus]
MAGRGQLVLSHFPKPAHSLPCIWFHVPTLVFRPHQQRFFFPPRASLVVQWLGTRLPVQRTRVRTLVQEDATCRGATKPMRHNY